MKEKATLCRGFTRNNIVVCHDSETECLAVDNSYYLVTWSCLLCQFGVQGVALSKQVGKSRTHCVAQRHVTAEYFDQKSKTRSIWSE